MRDDAMAQLRDYAMAGALCERDPADEATVLREERDQARAALADAEKKLAAAAPRIAALEDQIKSLGRVKKLKRRTKISVVELENASDYLRRGDVPEGLVYLERALPPLLFRPRRPRGPFLPEPQMTTNSVDAGHLRAFLERIEHLEEEKQAIADDIKAVYAEAKGTGYDVKIMREIIRIHRLDRDKHREEVEILEIYLAALGEA